LWCLSYISCSWIDIRKVGVLISIVALRYVFIVSYSYQTYFGFSGFIVNLDVSYMTTWSQSLHHIELVGNYSYFFYLFSTGLSLPHDPSHKFGGLTRFFYHFNWFVFSIWPSNNPIFFFFFLDFNLQHWIHWKSSFIIFLFAFYEVIVISWARS
jgi:hypothetical protein